jgi:hypothetical protein
LGKSHPVGPTLKISGGKKLCVVIGYDWSRPLDLDVKARVSSLKIAVLAMRRAVYEHVDCEES